MSWLRQQTIVTFMKHNPTWEVHIIPPHPAIAKHNLLHAHACDWSAWKRLYEYGGFLMDSDVISINPIPHEYLGADLCYQSSNRNDRTVRQKAFFGAAKGNLYMKRLDEYCEAQAAKYGGVEEQNGSLSGQDYNAFGVDALRHTSDEKVGEELTFDKDAFCYYGHDSDTIVSLWGERPLKSLSSACIGVHWYGGSPISFEREHDTSPTGTSWLERIARGE